MPWVDYRCPDCGAVIENQVFSAAKGALASAPYCGRCEHQEVLIKMMPIPAIGRMDASNGSTFQAFDIAREVVERNPATGAIERFQRVEHIDSVHTARRIEIDSEQRYRNGEGEPLRFRMLSQNTSNKDVGSFGTAGTLGEQSYDSGTPLQRSGRVSIKKHGEEAPDIAVGPGIAAGGHALVGDS